MKQSVQKKLLRFFTDSKNTILKHFAFIALLILVSYFRGVGYAAPADTIIRSSVVSLLLILFYTNYLWLIPSYLLKKKYLEYSIGVFTCTVILYVCMVYVFKALRPYDLPDDPNVENDMAIPFFIFMILVLTGATAAVKFFQQWIGDSNRIIELENSKNSVELEQLKNQINPHFLFNMLNNVNVLTRKDPEKASMVLMGLSDLLRYQLYDSARDSVLLTSDIHFLEDFLKLEKIRRDHFQFTISKEGILSGVQVAPLLFITFVENAVKHNNDNAKTSYVDLFFEVKGNVLFFKCINSKSPENESYVTSGGLGLSNIKRRLNLLYPDSHQLIIDDQKDSYSVALKIELPADF